MGGSSKNNASARAKKPGLSNSRGGVGLGLTIENFGPIKKAEMQLRPLTVFFGPNGTGKTFASKALHSAVGAMISNPGKELFRRHVHSIRTYAEVLAREMPMGVASARRFSMAYMKDAGKAQMRAASFFSELENRLEDIGARASSVFGEEGSGRGSVADLQGECKDLLAFYRKNRATLVRVAESSSARERSMFARNAAKLRSEKIRVQAKQASSSDFHLSEEAMRMVEINLHAKDLGRAISALAKVRWDNKELIVREGSGGAFYGQIAANFQVPPQDMLGRLKRRPARVGVGSVNFTLTPEAGSVEFPQDGVRLANMWSQALFWDSPVYWKLQGALESMRFAPSFARPRALDGVPQYFYDLATLVRRTAPRPGFSGVHASLEEVIGGRMVLNKAGLLRFQEKNGHGEYPMHATAAGIVNLGVLSLLIKNGVVDENTLVFIDEPESNLHPRWQKIMAEALAQLAGAGAYVVVATHSDWMLTAIANMVRRGELDESGEGVVLTEEQVGVWLFEKNSGGTGTQELSYDRHNGYIPKTLRGFSNDLHNETMDLLDAIDMQEHANAEQEPAE